MSEALEIMAMFTLGVATGYFLVRIAIEAYKLGRDGVP